MYDPMRSINAFQVGTEQRKQRETEAGMKSIGNAFATGDYTGAAKTAYGMGDISTGMEISNYGKGLEDQAAEQKRVGLIRYGMGLLQTPAQQRESMRPQITQALTGMGIPLDEQSAAAMDLSDEGIKATLMTLQDTDGLMKMYQAQMAPVEYGFQNVTGVGLVKTDPRAGSAEVAVASKRDPIVVNGVLVDPETYEPVGNYQTPDQAGTMTEYQRAQLALDRQKLDQSAQPSAPDLGDVKGIRETNEKRLQVFQESQRQFQTMTKLAEDATGASDGALGFAFFKTIDPTSTVREGEFAQAASSMGLGARTIAALEKLDSGQKFSPQLRKDLLAAAGHAYDLQKRDIQAMVERETAFAQRYNINPEDIVRNPIVDMPPPPPRVPLVSGMLNTIRGAEQPSTDLPPGFIEID